MYYYYYFLVIFLINNKFLIFHDLNIILVTSEPPTINESFKNEALIKFLDVF